MKVTTTVQQAIVRGYRDGMTPDQLAQLYRLPLLQVESVLRQGMAKWR